MDLPLNGLTQIICFLHMISSFYFACLIYAGSVNNSFFQPHLPHNLGGGWEENVFEFLSIYKPKLEKLKKKIVCFAYRIKSSLRLVM